VGKIPGFDKKAILRYLRCNSYKNDICAGDDDEFLDSSLRSE